MVNKDMVFSVLYCENIGCLNQLGYAGALMHNLETDQRKLLCLECQKKPAYKKWVTEMKWV